MKYCVPYSRNFKYINEVEEVIIMYNEEFNPNVVKTLRDNKDFEEYQNKRLIIHILDYDYFMKHDTLEGIIALREEAPNLNIVLMFNEVNTDYFDTIQKVKKEGIEFFFAAKVSDWDVFYGLISLGVSDIYIVEGLGFELNLLGPLAHAAGVSIRVFANVCQNSWYSADPLISFFIRPEGVPVYEPYVDVLEFVAESTKQREVLYKVYTKDQRWFGDLQEIIVGLDTQLDSKYLMPIFDKIRVGCRKKCIKGGSCNICLRLKDVSDSMNEKGFEMSFN